MKYGCTEPKGNQSSKDSTDHFWLLHRAGKSRGHWVSQTKSWACLCACGQRERDMLVPTAITGQAKDHSTCYRVCVYLSQWNVDQQSPPSLPSSLFFFFFFLAIPLYSSDNPCRGFTNKHKTETKKVLAAEQVYNTYPAYVGRNSTNIHVDPIAFPEAKRKIVLIELFFRFKKTCVISTKRYRKGTNGKEPTYSSHHKLKLFAERFHNNP